jgi:hypothetical protein
MRAQLKHLMDVASLPNIVIRIVPFSIGAHPGVESNFVILTLPASMPDEVFVEGLSGKFYLDRPDDLGRYRRVFNRLEQLALSPQESLRLIASIRSGMRD